jgi:hypothetical protein
LRGSFKWVQKKDSLLSLVLIDVPQNLIAMKKFYSLSFILFGLLALSSVSTFAQEKLVGGNMEDASKWNVTQNVTVEGAYATVTFNYTDDIPTAGSGGAMHVTCSNTADNNGTNVTIWQEVALEADHTYVIDGAFKDIGGINNYWCQVLIDTAAVVAGSDYKAESDAHVQINTWKTLAGCSENNGYSNIDITFQTFECESGEQSDTVVISQSGNYKFAVKMGLWNSVVPSTYDVVLDNLSLMDLAGANSIKNISNTITCSPNPVVNQLFVNIENNIQTVQVMNILGQNVYTINNVGTNNITIDFSAPESGVYYVIVTDINGNTGTIKTLKL